MSLTPYPTLRLKLTMPQALKLQFLPAVPGSNAAAAAAAAQAAADAAQAAANTATAATANKVDKSGDTMTGFLTLNADPNTNLQAATKQYVDAHGMSDAPSDGSLYGRLNATWAQAQPFDADLTSLAGASATNQWYYRSAANVWSPVTVGATMTFVGGVLNTTAGGGNVIAVGTPLNGQWARFTTAATIEGVDAANTGFQPLDADLTSLAAASATNVIYYRSAANTWGPVTVGTGLTFTGGTLAATGGGGTGNVSNSGTPTVGQYAKWVTATTIQGVSTATVASDIGAAPVGAEYITSVADATLTAERVLTDTATVTWDRTTAGQIKANAAGGSSTVTAPQGRLTLQTLTPVMTTTQAAKTTILYSPYVGNLLPIYNGTSFAMTTFAELSVATTDTTKSPAAIGASKVNDWFVWNDAGTVRVGHGPDWTSDTVRSAGTALVMVNGILLNNAAITNGPAAQRGTYVGTTRSNASSTLDWIYGAIASLGTAAWFGVWNAYNRVSVSTMVGDTTLNWTNGGAVKASNGSNAMRVSAIFGLAEDTIAATFICPSVGVPGTVNAVIGIGLDSTSAFSSGAMAANQTSTLTTCDARYSSQQLGWHFWQAMENSSGATSTFYGQALPQWQNGLFFDARM